jgi:hypothetical protein
MEEVIGILRTPSQYFSQINKSNISWFHALLGYYVVAYSEGVANLLSMGWDTLTAIFMPCIGALVGGVFGIILYGFLWFYVGSKIVGGSASLVEVVGVIGLALFWPGLISLGIVPLLLILPSQSLLAAVLVLVCQLALGAWSLFLSGIAIRHMAGLTLGRAVFVTFWLLGIVFLFGVAAAIIIPRMMA